MPAGYCCCSPHHCPAPQSALGCQRGNAAALTTAQPPSLPWDASGVLLQLSPLPSPPATHPAPTQPASYPRMMRSSEGVSEGGKHPHFSAVTEKAPRPSRRPRRPTGLQCGVLWRVARVTQNGTSPGLCACMENAAHKRGMTLGTHIARAP